MITLDDFCRELHNWYDVSHYIGNFRISNGVINLSDMVADGSLQDGQYFRIVGSVFNDGVYQYPASDLHDETFHGAVWAMVLPPSAIELFDAINEWISKAEADSASSGGASGMYQSESFGGYSYSKPSGLAESGAVASGGWKWQFRSALNKWRKIR